MKTRVLCTIGALVLAVAFGFAQNDRVDAVYLKDGSIIRGTILEQVPNVSLKIETRDGSVFVLEFSRILKIQKERVSVAQRDGESAGSSGSARARLWSSVGAGGLIYGDFWFSMEARFGVSLVRVLYLGIVVAPAFADEAAVYFGGEFGFTAHLGRVTLQPYASVGIGSVAGSSAFAVGPGVSCTFWLNKNMGVGPDAKYMFVPDVSDGFGLVYLTFVYQI